jgi:hypothetical protein
VRAKGKEPACKKKIAEVQIAMRMAQKKGRSLEEQYVMGSHMWIAGGVPCHGSPVGMIVGATLCYVDIKVPQLKCQVRVLKTSVVQCDDGQNRRKFEDVMEEEPQIGAVLQVVCTLSVKRQVQKSNRGLREMIYISVRPVSAG